jgi:hypothetical protein
MTLENAYLTQTEALTYVKAADTSSEFVEDCVNTASRWIDQHCSRHFYQDGTVGTPVARTFQVDDLRCLRFGPHNDLTSISTLKTDSTGDGTYETTIAASSYELGPLNAATRGEPFTALRLLGGVTFPTPTSTGRSDVVEVTGVWGWPAVPPQVKSACRILVAEMVKLQDAPLGFAGGMEMGTAYVGSMAVKKAQMMLAPLRHPDGFGIA